MAYTVGRPAASSSVRFGGASTSISGNSTLISFPRHPGTMPNTRSPGRSVLPEGAATMTPAQSDASSWSFFG